MRKSLRIASMVLAALLFFSYDSLKAQVKIGGNPASIDPAAILELESTKKGLLLPRVDDAGMAAISNSANAGFLVYYVGGGPAGVAGLFVKTGGVGGAMVRVSTETGTGVPWKTNGNPGVAGAFLGTTDNFPVDFKTNGATRLTIGADGKLVFGAGTVDDAVTADGNNILLLAPDGTVKKKDLSQSSVTSLNALKGDLDILLMDNAGTEPSIVTVPQAGAVPGRIELSFPTLQGQVIAGNTPTYGFMHIDDYTKLQDLMAADGIKVLPPLTVANAVAEGAVFTKNVNKWEMALSPATETTAGIVTIAAQTFVGDKTFSASNAFFDVQELRVAKSSVIGGAGPGNLFVEGNVKLPGLTPQAIVNSDFYDVLIQNTAASGLDSVKTVTVPGWKLTSTGIGQISTTSPTPAVGDATGNLAFATATTGTDFAVTSTGNTVTFNLPNASTADRGVVSTGAQEFGGDKSFAGKVHVGAAFGTPQVSPSNLIVNGSVGVKFRTAPAGSTIGPDDYIVLIAAAGAATAITLPNATECSGRIYVIKRIPGTNPATEEDNNVVVGTTGGQTINGIASTTISVVHTSITVMSDGANWQMLSRGTGF